MDKLEYDLAKKFIQDKLGLVVDKIKNRKDESGEELVEIYAQNGVVYCFDGIHIKEKFIHSLKKVNNFEEDLELNLLWRNYLINNTYGDLKKGYIEASIDSLVKEFNEELDNDIKNYSEDLSDYQEPEECLSWQMCERLLEMEEKWFVFQLNENKENKRLSDLRSGIELKKAKLTALVYGKIKQFLENDVEQSLNENGEVVFNFTEDQFDLFEYLKKIQENISFDFRYKLYRVQMEEEMCDGQGGRL